MYFFVMEGQGRTLEEIDTMYITKVTPWKSNKWVAPLPHEMAKIRKEAGTNVADEVLEPKNSDDMEKASTELGDTTDRAAATNGAATAAGANDKEAQV